MRNNIFLTSDMTTVADDLVKYIDINKNRKVLFVTTSGELFDEHEWIDKAREKMNKLGFEIIEYSITNKTKKEVQEAVDKVNIIYIAGGHAFYLLQKAQESGFIEIIQDFVKNGGIYIGQSAGCYLIGKSIEHAYEPFYEGYINQINNFLGSDLVDFVILPYFGRDDTKESFLNFRINHIYKRGDKIILLTDNQYIRVQEDGMYRIENVN